MYPGLASNSWLFSKVPPSPVKISTDQSRGSERLDRRNEGVLHRDWGEHELGKGGVKPEPELKQNLEDRQLSLEEPSAAVGRTEFCLQDQHAKIWCPTAQIVDPRETNLRLEEKYDQMEIGQAKKVSRKISPKLFPACPRSTHPPMRSQLVKCDVTNPW